MLTILNTLRTQHAPRGAARVWGGACLQTRPIVHYYSTEKPPTPTPTPKPITKPSPPKQTATPQNKRVIQGVDLNSLKYLVANKINKEKALQQKSIRQSQAPQTQPLEQQQPPEQHVQQPQEQQTQQSQEQEQLSQPIQELSEEATKETETATQQLETKEVVPANKQITEDSTKQTRVWQPVASEPKTKPISLRDRIARTRVVHALKKEQEAEDDKQKNEAEYEEASARALEKKFEEYSSMKRRKEPERDLTLQESRAKKRQSFHLKRIGEVPPNDTRDYDNPLHWRTISSMEPPDDDYPSTRALRAEKLGKEITDIQKGNKEGQSLLPDLLAKRTILYLHLSKYSAALADAETRLSLMIKQKESDVLKLDNAYHMKAMCLSLKGASDDALKAASKISKAYARVNVMASILMKAKKHKAAIQYLDVLAEFYKGKAGDVYYFRGLCYKRLQMHKQALRDFTKAVVVHPTHLDYRLGKARQLKEMGRESDAARELNDMILEPDSLDYETLLEIFELSGVPADSELDLEKIQAHLQKLAAGGNVSVSDIAEGVKKEKTIEEEEEENEDGEDGETKELEDEDLDIDTKDQPYVLFGVAHEKFQAQLWVSAAEIFKEVLETPNIDQRLYESTQNMIASATEKIELEEKALAFLSNELATRPTLADIYFERGSVHLRLNKLQEAFDDAEQSLALVKSAKAYYLLAQIHEEAESLDDAAANIAKGCAWENRDISTKHTMLGDLFYRNQDFQTAIDQYNNATAFKSSPELYAKKSIAYEELGKYPEAIMALTEGMGHVEAAKFPRLYMLRAKCNLALKNTEHASRDIAAAFKAVPDPQDPEWYSVRASINYAKRYFPEALSDCEYAISKATLLTPEVIVDCLKIKAKICLEKKAYDIGLKDINEAKKYKLARAECFCISGQIYTKMGNYVNAVDEFSKGLEHDYHYVEGVTYLLLAHRGFAYHCLGKEMERYVDWEEVEQHGTPEAQKLVDEWVKQIEMQSYEFQ